MAEPIPFEERPINLIIYANIFSFEPNGVFLSVPAPVSTLNSCLFALACFALSVNTSYPREPR